MSTPRERNNLRFFWLAWGLTGAGWQTYALRTKNGATGSETTRAAWHTDTPLGKLAFLAAFYTGTAIFVSWFPDHITKKINDSIDFFSNWEVVDEENGS